MPTKARMLSASNLSVVAVLWAATTCVAYGQDVFTPVKCGTLPEPRQRHGAVVVNNRLYVLGGQIPTEFTASVKSAPIASDCKIGAWRDEAAMLQPRSFIATGVQAIGSAIYVIGGNYVLKNDPGNSEKQKNCIWASVGADGVIQRWNRGPNFPFSPISCCAVCSSGDYLVVTGGSADREPVSDVLVSKIGVGGEPGPFQAIGKLPSTLWFHGCAVAGGKIYVWGGLPTRERDRVNEKVYSCGFDPARLVGWREEPQQMASPVYAAGFCSGTNFLVSVSGKYAHEYATNGIWFSRLREGNLQPWTFLKTDLPAWANVAVAVDQSTGRTFITGGTQQNAPMAGLPLVDEIRGFQIPVGQ